MDTNLKGWRVISHFIDAMTTVQQSLDTNEWYRGEAYTVIMYQTKYMLKMKWDVKNISHASLLG